MKIESFSTQGANPTPCPPHIATTLMEELERDIEEIKILRQQIGAFLDVLLGPDGPLTNPTESARVEAGPPESVPNSMSRLRDGIRRLVDEFHRVDGASL